MSNQQIYAKICVFALLGLNVGAYYYFWPRREQGGDVQTEVQPESKPLPPPGAVEKPRAAVTPNQLPEIPAPKPPPIHGAAFEKKEDAGAGSANEMVRKLLEHLREENKNKKNSPPDLANEKRQPELAPLFPNDKKPRPLPPLGADPLPIDLKSIDPSKIGITSPLTPKPSPGPWVVSMEKVGQQTLVTATLHAGTKQAVEFRILCDHVEKLPSSQEVLARGNVAFAAGGWKGHCQRLTLSLLEPRVVFEEKAHIGHLASSGTLVGDRVVWEIPSFPPSVQPGARPTGVLGAPDHGIPDPK